MIDVKNIPQTFLLSAIVGGRGIIDIYWYFPVLFSVYLCIPLFSYVSEENRNTIFGFLIIVGVIANVTIPFCISVFGLQIDWEIRPGVVGSYLLYVLTGYYFSRVKISKKIEVIIVILGVIGLIMHIVGTHVLSMRAGEIVSSYKGYNNLPAFLYSVAMFVFFKNIGDNLLRNRFFGMFVGLIKKYTFGIYLIHYFVMDIIKKYLYMLIFGLQDTSIIYRLTAPFVIIFVCIGVIEILRRIPIINLFVPQ